MFRTKRFSLKTKMLFTFATTVVVVMAIAAYAVFRIDERALDQNLQSSLDVFTRIAAQAVKTGLEFSDHAAVEAAVQPFTKQRDFSFIEVRDKDGQPVLTYRREGFAPVEDIATRLDARLDDEIFGRSVIRSDEGELGTITVGITLENRNKALSSASAATAVLGLVMVVVFVLITMFIANRITGPIRHLTGMARKLAKGDLDVEVVQVNSKDEIAELAGSFGEMIQAQKTKADWARQIAEGNLDVEVSAASEEDVLGNAMVTMKEALQTMQKDLQETIEAQKAGDIDNRCEPGKVKGAFSELLQGVNETLDAVIEPMLEGIDILGQYAQGDLSQVMRPLPGKQMVFSKSLKKIRENLKELIDEIIALTDSAEKGDLAKRADVLKFAGSYRQIVEGINLTIENITRPVNEAVSCLAEMAKGNLTVSVQGDYLGDLAVMKDSMNKTLRSLNEILSHVSVSAEEVANSSHQVADSSHALSQGAAKQASSLEEISASMNQIGSQTRQNAENATQANQLTAAAKQTAKKGNSQMKKMLSAMAEIKDSSAKIYNIIKAIDEIAFQTNLLALNAAVEAARAGAHGKGFAVVAEEVRNLAQRSAKAAEETTELIEDSVGKVENGSKLADITAQALDEIERSVMKVSDLVAEIAHASQEQALGIEQVNAGLAQIDQVTQANTAGAEESASASETLSSQAQQLKGMLARFQLNYYDRETPVRGPWAEHVRIVPDESEASQDDWAV